MHLSKSDYMKYRIHPAYLWYQKHARGKLPPITPNDQYNFDQGHLFESKVQQLFPGAVEVIGASWEFVKLAQQTQHLIEEGNDTIFQASFLTDTGLFCRGDILQKTTAGWVLIEVKSSTTVKQAHTYDVAFQKHVLEQLGFEIVACQVMHVNRNYSREGEINIERLVATRDITENVEALRRQVTQEIAEAQSVMEQAEVDDHPAYAGDLRSWLPIYFHLHPDIPEDSVLRLAQLKPALVREAYFSGEESMTALDTAQLTTKQTAQINACKQDQPLIDTEKIVQFLDTLQYPLYFLDYETSAHVLPLYDGTRPYQQVPFQYSLHRLASPQAELEHFEYIHQDPTLPVKPLAKQLLSEIGEQGTVLAWFDKFEKYCNRTIGELAPEYQSQMHAINQRMLDLRTPFANQWYVDKRFNGSSSIKYVMPVVAPKLSYKDLEIQEGGAAQRLWQQIWDGTEAERKDQVIADLIEYCKLDTLAMVEIYRFLREVVRSGTSKYADDDEVVQGVLL